MQESVCTFAASRLVIGLHAVRLDAGIVDKERDRLGRVRAQGTRCRMVGQDRNGDRLIPARDSLPDGTHDACVEILNRSEFQIDIPLMSGLVTRLDMKVDKVVRAQSLDGSSAFPS